MTAWSLGTEEKSRVNSSAFALPVLWINIFSIGLKLWLFHSTLELNFFDVKSAQNDCYSELCVTFSLAEKVKKKREKSGGGIKIGGEGKESAQKR